MSLQAIKTAITEFEQLQEELADFGASDTEPCAVFQVMLVRAFKGKDYMPASADDWELYSDTPGATTAARRLTVKAKRIRKMIQDTTLGQSGALEKYLRDYCWRVDW